VQAGATTADYLHRGTDKQVGWMFYACSVPSVLFLFLCVVPEAQDGWLRIVIAESSQILARIGGNDMHLQNWLPLNRLLSQAKAISVLKQPASQNFFCLNSTGIFQQCAE